MGGQPWTEAEMARFYSHPHEGYDAWKAATGSARTYHAWRVKRSDADVGRASGITPSLSDNAVAPQMHWREWNDPMRTLQGLRRKAKGHLDEEATIEVATDQNVAFIVLGDTHIGAWSSDHDLFERITDEILSIPNLYIALLGDMAHAAIKLRNVTEVADNLLPTDLQLLYLQSWLEEIQERVLFATWANHEIERPEAQAGLSPFADLYRRCARHYFNGIGHLTVRVGDIDYRIAASHHFQGRSIYSPVHGVQRYLTIGGGQDRDIGIAGDSHVPGVLKFTHGRETKLAVNCGSSQLFSGYAARYFSLFTHPTFPVIVLNGRRKDFYACWSMQEYLDRVTHTFAVA